MISTSRPKPQSAELVGEVAGVARDQRLQIALHDGGAGALELVVFADDAGRGHDLPGGLDRREDVARPRSSCAGLA